MAAKFYALFKNDGKGGPVIRMSSDNFDRKTALVLAASIRRKSGEKVYARAVRTMKGPRHD